MFNWDEKIAYCNSKGWYVLIICYQWYLPQCHSHPHHFRFIPQNCFKSKYHDKFKIDGDSECEITYEMFACCHFPMWLLLLQSSYNQGIVTNMKIATTKKIFDNHNKTCSNINSTIWTKTQNMSLTCLMSLFVHMEWNDIL
jgi:hypothetical protein